MVALFNPFVGVCVYWILEIVRPQYMFAWAGADGSYSQAVAIATIIGWCGQRFGTWRLAGGRAIVLVFLGYTAWVVLSSLSAPNSGVAFAFLAEHAKRTIMFLIAVSLADSQARVQQLTWVIAGSAGFLCLELNIQYFGGWNQPQLGYGGLDNNALAIALITALASAVYLALYVQPNWQKALAICAAALIGHTIFLTFSRGGFLGLLVVAGVALVTMPKRPRYFLGFAIAAFAAYIVTGPELRERFLSAFAEQRDYSAQSRLDLWRDTLVVIREHPVFGAGPDHFPLIAADFGWPAGKEAHSLWLQLAAEIGLPGIVLLALFYVLAIRRVWPLVKLAGNEDSVAWARTIGCIVVASLAGFAVSAQFVTLEGLEIPLYIVVLAVGALRASDGMLQTHVPSSPRNRYVRRHRAPR